MAQTKVALNQINGDSVSVKNFGTVGDGISDDSAAIQLAFDYIVTNGGALDFDGTETYLCNSSLSLELTGLQ